MSNENGQQPELGLSSETSEALAGAFEQVKTIYDVKLAELEVLQTETQARIAALKAEIQPLAVILRQAGLIDNPWKRGHKAREEKPKGKAMSEKRLSRFVAYMIRYPKEHGPVLEGVEGSFTAPLIADTYGLEKSAVNKAVQTMREDGRLRVAGKVRRPDGVGAATAVYVFDQ